MAIANLLLWALVGLELRGYDERRERLRDEFSVAHGVDGRPDVHEGISTRSSVVDFGILPHLWTLPYCSTNCCAPAPPRDTRGPAAEIWRKAAAFADEQASDGIGSSIARVGTGSPLLAIVGHIDEIGLIITHVDEKGFLWFTSVGGWDPQILVGQRVSVLTKDGPSPASPAANRSTCSRPTSARRSSN